MKAKKIASCLMDYGYTSTADWDEYHELVRLATIGRYTEMAFSDDNPLTYMRGLDIAINSVDELIKWGEEQEGDND